MNTTSTKNILLLILLGINIHIFGGFLPGTQVKTTTGYQSIETIKSGQNLTSYCPIAGFFENRVTFAWKNATDACVAIRYLQSELVASAKQQFYLPESDSWVAASELKSGDKLLSEKHGHITVDEIEPIVFAGFTHCVQLGNIHNFCVSDDDIVTHNMDGIPFKLRLRPIPSPAEIGIGILFCIAAYIVRKLMVNFGAHEEMQRQQDLNRWVSHYYSPYTYNAETDFDNPYAYYNQKKETEDAHGIELNNSSFSSNDVSYNNDYIYNRHNDFVAQGIYQNTSVQKTCPAVIIDLAPTKNSNLLQNHSINSDIILQTTIPDPEIRKKPTGCPIPDVQIPTHTGGCGEVIEPEKIVHPTPMPKPEPKKPGCYPIPRLEEIRSLPVLTQEIAEEHLIVTEKAKTFEDIVGEAVPQEGQYI